jgi:hypothetical protein
MISSKNLTSGGDVDVPKFVDISVSTGIDLIELMWIPRDGQPRATSPEVHGYQYPKVIDDEDFFAETVNVEWVDKILKFYPDGSGRCWGYVFDTEYNRKKLLHSFSNNWFRIVDKKIRDELMKEAEEAGISTKPAEKVQFIIKKTKREREAEDKIKATERKLEELEKRKRELEEALAEATGKKIEYVGKRVKGRIPKDRKEQILNGDNVEDANPITD